ncbi:MAG TPA: TIGR03960 family B12-binding radical SAM protein [Thermotogota bacterium]|mgnify:CR=1 FL=1|nr:TIGR03960 family B12-binding radical SAM protein [Thermotogota bacterium]HRW92491.1 TIGR03960 family B12-binding radical SAM protein [Thermotogota bacterium]
MQIQKWLHRSGVLHRVLKPSRYIGNEIHSVEASSTESDFRFLLVFPDVYEIGMSHLGLRILYDILNRQPGVWAQRAFLPWFDMREEMARAHIPPFSLEEFAAPSTFDVVGFTLQYELSFPGVLDFLSLSEIHPLATERRESDPIILGGGPCAFNPEPLAPFFDAFLVGDGEQAVVSIVENLRQTKHMPKAQRLFALSKIPGVYVPRFYRQTKAGVVPLDLPWGSVATRIRKAAVDLENVAFPTRQIVPFFPIVHDRVMVEVLRGCTHGCRFCHAGMVYRPVRNRSAEEIIDLSIRALEQTGYEELSLLSLSTLDHPELSRVVNELYPLLKQKAISLSIPSSRIDRFGLEVAAQISGLRKTGLTFAPEAGSQSMRDRINKNVEVEDLRQTVQAARQMGWSRLKLYFMAGLPGESEEDRQGIVHLVEKIRGWGIKNVSISVAGFVPKPHTPFQFARQASVDELHSYLHSLLPLKKLGKYEFHQPEMTFVEGVLSRGDRSLAPVLQWVQQNGGTLCAWKEGFSFSRWMEAFAACGIDTQSYTRTRSLHEPLPWDHIDSGITREFLLREWQNSNEGKCTPDCRWSSCSQCGVCINPIQRKG